LFFFFFFFTDDVVFESGIVTWMALLVHAGQQELDEEALIAGILASCFRWDFVRPCLPRKSFNYLGQLDIYIDERVRNLRGNPDCLAKLLLSEVHACWLLFPAKVQPHNSWIIGLIKPAFESKNVK
jgi:hypothetical protein